MHWKWLMIATLVSALLGGCSDTVDIAALPEHYRELFREAAAMQGVGTTVDGWVRDEWDWSAELGTWPGAASHANSIEDVYCRIIIDVSQLYCPDGNTDQAFRVASRHELGHCQHGSSHSTDPNSYMHAPAPCYPVD